MKFCGLAQWWGVGEGAGAGGQAMAAAGRGLCDRRPRRRVTGLSSQDNSAESGLYPHLLDEKTEGQRGEGTCPSTPEH